MNDVIEIVDAQVEAYRRRDIDAFLSFYASDVQVCTVDGRVQMDGLDEMRERYGKLFEDSPDLAVDVASRIVVGDHVVDEERITGFNLPGYPTELHAAVVYQLRDGKIGRVILVS